MKLADMLVRDFLELSAERLPEKIALVCDGKRLTYSQIDAMADRLAQAMQAKGLRRGDRVAVYLNNSVEAVAGIFATLKAGGVFVPVNPTTKRDKLIYILDNCRASGLLAESRQAAMVGELPDHVPFLRFSVICGDLPAAGLDFKSSTAPVLGFDAIQNEFPAVRPARVNIDLDLACLIYTSGTTGDPKGVMCDHSNMVFAASSIISYLKNVEEDIVIGILPLSFDYGLYQLLMTFKFGGTLVLERGFAYPAPVLKRIEEEHVTGFPGVPTIFAILVRMDLSAYDLSSLRYLTNTAAALPPSHIQELRAKFPWATLFSMYGLTETKRTLYLPPDQLEARPGSVGIAIPGTEVWIEDENGKRLGAGEIGELVVRGRHVMRGYWEAPEATAARYRPGSIPGERLCYTGDLFRMDDEGYLYFVSRKDDIIKSRGEKVAPKEVENVLYSLQGVVEAAVIGVPDPILGQALKAILVVNDSQVSEGKVLAHCRQNLEDFMVPKFVEFRESLPKTSSGKIKKTDLT
ncbi:MAG TPA: AMP-binding protein [Anaerolineales bacterium]|nr:AMP-binding protein [Anaerolineales bacterium]